MIAKKVFLGFYHLFLYEVANSSKYLEKFGSNFKPGFWKEIQCAAMCSNEEDCSAYIFIEPKAFEKGSSRLIHDGAS